MAPTVTAGVVVSSLNAITPAFPAGYTPVPDDISLIIGECEGVTAPGAYTVPSGWAHVSSDGTSVSPVLQGTNTRLTVLWKRLVGGETAPSLGDSGDHNIGAHLIVSGCPAAGNPWDIAIPGVEATSDTSAAWPTGASTTVDDCTVLLIASTSADIGTAQISTITGSNLTSLTERVDGATTSGNGGVIICYSGTLATAGAIGSPVATLTTAGFKAFMILAMAPAGIGSTPRWARGYPPGQRYIRRAVQRSTRW